MDRHRTVIHRHPNVIHSHPLRALPGTPLTVMTVMTRCPDRQPCVPAGNDGVMCALRLLAPSGHGRHPRSRPSVMSSPTDRV